MDPKTMTDAQIMQRMQELQIQQSQLSSRDVAGADRIAKEMLTLQQEKARRGPAQVNATNNSGVQTTGAPSVTIPAPPGTAQAPQTAQPPPTTIPQPPKPVAPKVNLPSWGGPGGGRRTTNPNPTPDGYDKPGGIPAPPKPPEVEVKPPESIARSTDTPQAEGTIKPPEPPQATAAPPPQTPSTSPPSNPLGPTVQPEQIPMPKEEETLIPDQDPDNPLSNARALERSVAQEYRPIMPTTADVAEASRGYGMGDWTDTSALADEAVRIANEQADQTYNDEQRTFLNRYKGLGVSGNEMRRAAEMAQKYATNKAATAENIRRQFNELGFGRNRALMGDAAGLLQTNAGRQEGRYNTAVNSAQQQNAQAVAALQGERDHWRQRDLVDQRAQYDQYALDQAAKGDLMAQLYGMVGDMLMPPQPSVADQVAMAQLRQMGVPVQQPQPGAGNPVQGIMNLLGGQGGGNLEALVQLAPLLGGDDAQMLQLLPLLMQGGGTRDPFTEAAGYPKFSPTGIVEDIPQIDFSKLSPEQLAAHRQLTDALEAAAMSKMKSQPDDGFMDFMGWRPVDRGGAPITQTPYTPDFMKPDYYKDAPTGPGIWTGKYGQPFRINPATGEQEQWGIDGVWRPMATAQVVA